MDPALIALIGTAVGGCLIKILDHFLAKRKNQEDHAIIIRRELREDLARYREDLKEESKESEKWQRSYWELKSELLIGNHKTNAVLEVVDKQHPDQHLKESLEGLENPGK